MIQHLGTCWGGAIWFSPEKAYTVHHMGSSMILTVEGMYCPSSGELYNFDRRGHVLSIICGRDGELYGFFPEKARSLRHLGTCWGALRFCSKRARPVHHLERRARELCGFDWRGHVLSIIWGSFMVLSLRGHLLSTIWGCAEELYGFDPRGHVLSTIWWRAGELYGARHRRCNHYPVCAILMLTF
jgi:hypothetical protein